MRTLAIDLNLLADERSAVRKFTKLKRARDASATNNTEQALMRRRSASLAITAFAVFFPTQLMTLN
jgi:hypothetical protein